MPTSFWRKLLYLTMGVPPRKTGRVMKTFNEPNHHQTAGSHGFPSTIGTLSIGLPVPPLGCSVATGCIGRSCLFLE